ncbi:MAG: zinc ribbon domain-containing protein [Eubacteriales bacterium]|nr:zinc ribbon domain-containing protein [Clostridiales bacterium]MDY5710507.1 zinc ribbon domain-containing protein [Eubacteriales bacterium]
MSGNTVLCIIIGAVLLCVAVPAMRFFHNAGNILSYILSALKSTGAVERPKIRSLSSAGDLFLDRIKRDFPEYNPAMVLNGVKKDARIYLQSAKEGHTLFREGVSDSFRERLAYSLPTDVKGGIEVYNAALSDYDDRGRDRILVFQAAAEYLDSSDALRPVRLTLKYIAAYDGNVDGEVRGFNCPNCGAPLPIVGSKICHYCGTGIKSSAGLGWILTDVTMD